MAKSDLFLLFIAAIIFLLAYHFGLQELRDHHATGLLETPYIRLWYVFDFIIPLFPLFLLARGIGFYRGQSERWYNVAAASIVIGADILMIGAPWPCLNGCA